MRSIIEAIFGLVCHQIEGRSPQAGGLVFPLCARCAGLYLGLFGSQVAVLVRHGLAAGMPYTDAPTLPQRQIPGIVLLSGLGSLMLPFLVDGWGNTLGFWQTGETGRMAAGAACGLALGMLVTSARTSRMTASPAIFDVLTAASTTAGLLLLLTSLQETSVWTALSAVALAGFVLFVWSLMRAGADRIPRRMPYAPEAACRS